MDNKNKGKGLMAAYYEKIDELMPEKELTEEQLSDIDEKDVEMLEKKIQKLKMLTLCVLLVNLITITVVFLGK